MMKRCLACSSLCHAQARFCPTCGATVREAPTADADPFLGQILAEKYLITTLLGEGGMGRVYRADQVALEKPVAVKVLHRHLMGDEVSVARFNSEAREASRINHPNVVTVFEFGETPYGVMYLVMELLRGRPLADLIVHEHPLAFDRIVGVFRQVLSAVGAAHQVGIIHRDLKPDNVFIEQLADGFERVKVIDFGIAKRFDEYTKGLTAPGMVCGTPEYMSPEQVQGDPLDPRSDVYSLGVMLYELLTGTPPFTGGNAAEIMIRNAETDPEPPSAMSPDREIPAALDAIVLWALAKKREERIQSADEFRRVLDSWLLVSGSPEDGASEIAATSCPSCNALNVERTDRCRVCGFQLPTDSPREGLQFLVDRLGARPAGDGIVASLRAGTSSRSNLPAVGTESLDGIPLARSDSAVVRYVPLVGRERELVAALRIVDTGGALRLTGESGAGKSRLLDEVASRAREADFAVIRIGARDDTLWPSPLWPIRRAIQLLIGPEASGLDSCDGVQRLLRKLGVAADWQPALCHLLGHPESSHRRMARAALRREFPAAFRELVNARVQGRKVALLLEDLDAMDAPSRWCIGQLLGQVASPSLICVVTQAQVEGDAEPCQTVSLGPLTRDESRSLALRKLGGQELPREVSAHLDLAGGNPFYIDALCRLLREGGLPEQIGRRIELIDARLDQLPLHLRRLLQRIAVHGGRVPLDRLEATGTEDAVQLEQNLAALDGKGLVDCGADWAAASHHLLEEAMLAGMPAEARRQAHLGFLRDQVLDPRTVGAQIRHAMGAEDGERAVEALEVGAGVAFVYQDLARAIQWLQAAFQRSRLQWGRGQSNLEAQTRTTIEIGRRLSEILFVKGDLRTADAVLQEVQQFSLGQDVVTAAAILLDQARQAMHRGKLAIAEDLITRALRQTAAGGTDAVWMRGELLHLLGEVASRRGNTEQAFQVFAEGFALTEPLNRVGSDQPWRFLVALAELRRGLGQVDEAEEYLHHALTMADAAGHLVGLQRINWLLGEINGRRGEHTSARYFYREAVRYAQELGDHAQAAQLSLLLGETHRKAGERDLAVEAWSRARACAGSIGLASAVREAERQLAAIAQDPPPAGVDGRGTDAG
jgi:serine/threonine-protein kinase